MFCFAICWLFSHRQFPIINDPKPIIILSKTNQITAR